MSHAVCGASIVPRGILHRSRLPVCVKSRATLCRAPPWPSEPLIKLNGPPTKIVSCLGPSFRDRTLEEHLGSLERLAESLPEAHPVRLLVESAVGTARTRGAGYAGSAASRSRSKTEGRLSTLRGSLSRLDAFARMDA